MSTLSSQEFLGGGSAKLVQPASQHLSSPDTPPQQKGSGFFDSWQGFWNGAGNAAGDTVKNTLDQYRSAAPKFLDEASKAKVSPDQGLIENTKNLAENAAGATASGIDTVFAPVTQTIKTLSDAISNNKSVQDAATSGGVIDKAAGGYGDVMKRLQDWSAAHPEAARNLNSLATIGGAAIGEKPVTDLAKGAATEGGAILSDAANYASSKISPAVDAVKGAAGRGMDVAKGVAGVIGDTAGAAKRVGENFMTNLDAKSAEREAINSLPTEEAKSAVKSGVDMQDAKFLGSVAEDQKPALQKLAEVTKKFANGETKTNPVEVVGRPIMNRIREVEAEASKVGAQLSESAKNIGPVTTREIVPRVFEALRKVPGLEGLKLNRLNTFKNGVLDFADTVLSSPETKAARQNLNRIFTQAVKDGSGQSKHLLRQELFEVLGGKKKSLMNLTGTEEGAYNAVRRGLSDVLDSKNSAYKRLNQSYAKMTEPLNELGRHMKSLTGAPEDLKDMASGLLARRITSMAKSNPEIRNTLQKLDSVTSKAGKSRLSVETLQDFYNILDKYYDISAKTGFQGQVKAGIEKARNLQDLVTSKVTDLAGQTPAVRVKALEDFMDSIFNGKAAPTKPEAFVPQSRLVKSAQAAAESGMNRGFAKNPLADAEKTPYGISPEAVARKVDGGDLRILRDFVEKGDIDSYAAGTTLMERMGLKNLGDKSKTAFAKDVIDLSTRKLKVKSK